MDGVHICKLPLENLHGESITVYTTWADESFSVNIFHEDRAWQKHVSEDGLKFLSSYTQNSVEEYLVETKRALSCDGGCREFTYSFIKSEFIWKKIVDSVHGIKVKFGSLLLDEMPVATFAENAVNYLLNHCLSLETENNSLKKENDNLISANVALRTHVGSITKLKTEMEETLYAKSLAVLNAKKEKINELQEFIENHRAASGTAVDKSENTKKELTQSKSDLYGSETEVDTDESSDRDCWEKSSAMSTSLTARINEEEKQLLPSAPKLPKLDDVSSGHPTKSLTGSQDDDVCDILVPARRKKNIKSGICR